MNEYLTVQEAAERSGVSVATIRRWAIEGKVPAVKRGRQWLIRGGYTASPERRHRTSAGDQLDIQTALRHIQSVDIKELWVPDVLRFEDFLTGTARDSLIEEASLRLEAPERIQPLEPISHPKTPILNRNSALLALPDRLAYHAAVLPVLEEGDRLIPSSVFSARPSPDPKYMLLKGRDQWLRWRSATLDLIASGYDWMVKTDITSYFDFIQHRVLFADLERLPIPDASRIAIRRMLTFWQRSPGAGIPQGPDASRVLGNFYLLEVDQEMVSGPWAYTRYLDDIRVLGRTRQQAMSGMRTLEEAIGRRGNVLSSQKTTMLRGVEAIEDTTDDRLDAIEYGLRFSHDHSSAQQLRDLLKAAVAPTSRMDLRSTRFSLWRLRELKDRFAIPIVLGSLDQLAPVAPIVATYLQPHLHMPSVRRSLAEFLIDPARNLSEFLSGWLLGMLLDANPPYEEILVSYARTVARNANEPAYHRAIAFSFLGEANEAADIAWLRRRVRQEHNPDLLRSVLVALRRADQMDRETADIAVNKAPVLKNTVKFLREQRSLPSLVLADKAHRRRI